MKQRCLVTVFTAFMLMFFFTAARAVASSDPSADQDTDTRMVDARVVEVTDARISVIARTGVEHVIAVDRLDTRVTIDGQVVSLKDVREGDVITTELDAYNSIKFAKNIAVGSSSVEIARHRR